MEQTHESKHPKQEFQVERLAFFSDAVFAIAITLLIIEFKVPHVDAHSTYQGVLAELKDMKADLLALLLTYFLISIYWIRHHFLYKYIHDYNKQVVVANMAALLPIIFLPFSTAFYAECSKSEDTMMLGLQLLFINHFFAGASIYLIYWFAMIRHKHLSLEVPLNEKVKFYEQTLFTAIIFLVLFIVSLIDRRKEVMAATLVIFLLIRAIVLRIWKKRLGLKVGLL